jgi:ABC-type transporter Mla subunit MlaD
MYRYLTLRAALERIARLAPRERGAVSEIRASLEAFVADPTAARWEEAKNRLFGLISTLGDFADALENLGGEFVASEEYRTLSELLTNSRQIRRDLQGYDLRGSTRSQLAFFVRELVDRLRSLEVSILETDSAIRAFYGRLSERGAPCLP